MRYHGGMVRLNEETQVKIDKLLRALRAWHPGVPEASLDELCRRFDLPALIVRRLADSEGFDLGDSDGVPEAVDPDASTRPIDLTRKS